MTSLVTLARAAGRAGQRWIDFTFREDVQAIVDHSGDGKDIDAAEAAHADGIREWKVTPDGGGWKTFWTTASPDYDTFGTETVEDGGLWRGKVLRRVIAHPDHATYQRDRYGSGLHPSFDEDPRVEERRAEERRLRYQAEDAARDARRAKGLAWLAALSDAELSACEDGDDHGIGYVEISQERRRREKAAEDAAQAATWDRCRAIVPEGAILVDDGSPGSRGVYGGWVKGRDPHVYYSVQLRDDYDRNADRATVVGEGGDAVASLEFAAEWIQSGRLRVVSAEDVPPRPVLERLGHEQIKRILRVTAAGRTVWVGSPRFNFGSPLVLDEKGRIVRARKVVEEALAAYHAERM